MSDPNAGSSSPGSGPATPGPTPGPSGDWRDERRAERAARREARHAAWGGAPIGGIIILIVGIVFFAGNFGFHLPERWWAVLILIPAVAGIVSAIRFYRLDNRMSSRVTGAATGGLVMLALALALFFGLNWGFFWPVILILVGVGIITRSYWQR